MPLYHCQIGIFARFDICLCSHSGQHSRQYLSDFSVSQHQTFAPVQCYRCFRYCYLNSALRRRHRISYRKLLALHIISECYPALCQCVGYVFCYPSAENKRGRVYLFHKRIYCKLIFSERHIYGFSVKAYRHRKYYNVRIQGTFKTIRCFRHAFIKAVKQYSVTLTAQLIG